MLHGVGRQLGGDRDQVISSRAPGQQAGDPAPHRAHLRWLARVGPPLCPGDKMCGALG
jgi:hypothetical protein